MTEQRPVPRAGEVWYVNFDPQVGREQRGARPALVVSTDDFNSLPHELAIVVPITTRDRDLFLHVRISPPEGGLGRPSVAMCDQVKSQSLDRFIERRGEVKTETLQRVQGVLAAILGGIGPTP